MPMIEESFPAITRAATLMARCNGGINRGRRVNDFLYDITPVLMHAPHDLNAIDEWLGARNEEDFMTIVDGERGEAEKLLADAPPGTDMLLDDLFDVI